MSIGRMVECGCAKWARGGFILKVLFIGEAVVVLVCDRSFLDADGVLTPDDTNLLFDTRRDCLAAE